MRTLFIKGMLLVAVVAIAQLSSAGEVKLTKEKSSFRFSVPPLIEPIPREATYKFIYPRVLRHYNEKEFSTFAKSFSDVDGYVNQPPRKLLAKKMPDNAPTDYTFELVTTGMSLLERLGTPYINREYRSGFVQDFQYYFACSLKIYKGDKLVKELVIDDGEIPYKVTFFKNYRLEQNTDLLPYEGYLDARQLEDELKPSSNSYRSFCYLLEYSTYKQLYEKACFVILNYYGEYNFKGTFPITLVHEKDAAAYAEFNTRSAELLNTLNSISSFENIRNSIGILKSSADYFEQYSAKPDIDKNLRLASLKHAAISRIMLGETGRAFELIRDHDQTGFHLFGSMRSILFDLFNLFSARGFLQNLNESNMVESVTLNDYFERDLAESRAASFNQYMSEKAVVEERRRNEMEVRFRRNIGETNAVVYYKNGTYRPFILSIPFYLLDMNGDVETSCGRKYYTVNANPIPKKRNIDDVASIIVTTKEKKTYTFIPVLITDNSFINLRRLCEYKSSANGYTIAIDRTAYEDNSLLIIPENNNPKKRGYPITQILSKRDRPLWIKNSTTISNAIEKGDIDNNEEGAQKLCELLNAEKLPSAEL